MQLHGKHLINGDATAADGDTFTATNPNDSTTLPTKFHEATAAEVDHGVRAAAAAFPHYRRKSGKDIGAFLDTVVAELEGLGDALLSLAHDETGLPAARLQSERGRMLNQVRIFAALARDGAFVGARIDRPDAKRQPLPKPDVRAMNIGVGPVVVFGASNFPFAISVAGTDTVSALAAGCPVVVKAHPAHPGTSEMVGRALAAAVAKAGMPSGVFCLLQGAGHEVGLALVRHPETKAVAFTGSLRGGRALFDAAATRPDPVPVYAEMGSVNPVLVLPGAVAERGDKIAAAYVQSMTMGVGQFCTSPGLVLGFDGEGLDRFLTAAGIAARAVAPATMLHPGIHRSFTAGVARIENTGGVTVVGRSEAAVNATRTEASCVLFATTADVLDSHPYLAEEVFGPTSTTVRCRDKADLDRIVRGLAGHLVASVHATPADLAEFGDVLALLETKVGRIVWNGFGTGIEVCAAMNHSGPYPATTDAHFTSIGHASVHRFVRPICYQNFPEDALPEALRDRNSLGLHRLIDGKLTTEDV